MNQDALVDQARFRGVRDFNADESEKPKLSNQVLSEITGKYAAQSVLATARHVYPLWHPVALMLYTVQHGFAWHRSGKGRQRNAQIGASSRYEKRSVTCSKRT